MQFVQGILVSQTLGLNTALLGIYDAV